MKLFMSSLAAAIVFLTFGAGGAQAATCTASLSGLPEGTICVGTLGKPCKCSASANGTFTGSGTLTFTDGNCTAADMISCEIAVTCSSPRPVTCTLKAKPTSGMRTCNVRLDYSGCL